MSFAVILSCPLQPLVGAMLGLGFCTRAESLPVAREGLFVRAALSVRDSVPAPLPRRQQGRWECGTTARHPSRARRSYAALVYLSARGPEGCHRTRRSPPTQSTPFCSGVDPVHSTLKRLRITRGRCETERQQVDHGARGSRLGRSPRQLRTTYLHPRLQPTQSCIHLPPHRWRRGSHVW